MPGTLHILSFLNILREEKQFIKSLLCRSLTKRRLILEKASSKQLRLIQKCLTLFIRGEIGVTRQFLHRIKRSKKLTFLEQKFNKIRSDPHLRQHILSLASILHLFCKVILKKKMTIEPVETFVFLPFSTYNALDNRAKRTDTLPIKEIPSSREEEQPVVESTEALAEVPEQSPVGKDVTKSYRSAQIKKVLLDIKKSHGSEAIIALPNLEDLIQAALSNKRKAHIVCFI